jgi:3-phenylpropionate/trans-cinnamate dioxygenase ferredoxin reductase subunit
MAQGRIVVIGAGQAGASLVAALRAHGHDGPVTLVGAEDVPPYQRPPLSKKYLLGDMALERLFLRPERFYAEQDIELRLSTRVSRIDRAAQVVELENGETLPYDLLALTTGSDPIRLPSAVGGDLAGVYIMRDLADADALAPQMQNGRKALVIGGGYIGLEAAAVLSSRGVQVTLVELAERILRRVAAPETADYFRALHQRHGVEILEGVGLERLTGEGQVSEAALSDGRTLPVDFALVGVGIKPGIALAEAAGLEIDNGIKVDDLGRSSDPKIFAAGDCASFPYGGNRIRLESVPNAIEQAEAAAVAMLGGQEPYRAKPWFWSDQYDVKLQIAGLNTGYDQTVLRRGAKEGSQSVWYFAGDTLLAVDAMNAPREYMMGRRLIEAGKSISPEQAGDPDVDLKALL